MTTYYINDKIFGVPKGLKKGGNTRYKHKSVYPYVHKVMINTNVYFKVQIHRQNTSKIKYFKTLHEAKLFVDMLKVNKYL